MDIYTFNINQTGATNTNSTNGTHIKEYYVKHSDHLQVVKELEEDIIDKDKLIYELQSTINFAEEQRKDLREKIESLKCCGNCIYQSDNVCLCNSIDVLEQDNPCGAWQPKESN